MFEDHARKFGAEFLQDTVEKIYKKDEKFIIKTLKKEIFGKTIILSLGSKFRRLDVPGEKKFLGKGVSYCAVCDRNFFKNKTVAIIGGGNSATKTILLLEDLVKKMYVVCRKDQLKCEPSTLKKIDKIKNVEILYDSIPLEISGEKTVKQIQVQKATKKQILNVEGVFIQIGATPNEIITKELGLKTDKHNFIKTDKQTKTNVSGAFAAGDITNHPLRQIITSAAEGAVAAKSAYDYLKQNYF